MNKKQKAVPLILTAVIVFCNGCGEWFEYKPPEYELVENSEMYTEIFKEWNVEAEIVVEDEKDYLQLVFPNQMIALYRSSLERIELDLERKEADEYLNPGKLRIYIEGDETAMVSISIGKNSFGRPKGWTGGEFVLPDFSEMLPDRGFLQDDVSTLQSIESWITEEELADLYKMAKDMEQKMLEYDLEE